MKLWKDKNAITVWFIEAVVNGNWEQVSLNFSTLDLAMQFYNRGQHYANKYKYARISSKQI